MQIFICIANYTYQRDNIRLYLPVCESFVPNETLLGQQLRSDVIFQLGESAGTCITR
jgi:hypothetical protein